MVEYGAKIEYRWGRKQVRVDMLSHMTIHHETHLLAQIHDELDLTVIGTEQNHHFLDLWLRGEDKEDNDGHIRRRQFMYVKACITRLPRPSG